jgi:hypothetical protein
MKTLIRRTGVDGVRKLMNKVANHGSVADVNDSTLAMWKHAGAAFAERCRDWEHLPGCEYATHGTSNLLSTNTEGHMVCSCGLGKFPGGYKPNIPIWKELKKHCVRVAISPFFYTPMAEGSIEDRKD